MEPLYLWIVQSLLICLGMANIFNLKNTSIKTILQNKLEQQFITLMANPLVQQGEVWKNGWQKVVIISSFLLKFGPILFLWSLIFVKVPYWECVILSLKFNQKKKRKKEKLKLVFTTSASYGPNSCYKAGHKWWI